MIFDNVVKSSRYVRIFRLISWNRPAGRLTLVIPCLWAVFLASQEMFPTNTVVIIVLFAIAASAMGCVINDVFDRKIDQEIKRTRNRPLASGTVSIRLAIVITIVAFALSSVLIRVASPFSFWVWIATVPIIIYCPYTKRNFPIPQLFLSIAWGSCTLVGWSAVTNRLESPIWLLWGATFFWTFGFGSLYGMLDRKDDQRMGLHSSAIFFGRNTPKVIGVCFLGTAFLLGVLGISINLQYIYWVTLACSILVWLSQYFRLRAFDVAKSLYGRIFAENVWVGMVILIGMIFGRN